MIVRDLGDRAAEGRAYGNLGNTHYLLGDFDKAIQYHEEVCFKTLIIVLYTQRNLLNIKIILKILVLIQCKQ